MQKYDPQQVVALLRARRERPCRCRTSDERDDLATV
jgi:hypothetical protein